MQYVLHKYLWVMVFRTCIVDAIFIAHHSGWRNGNSEKTSQPCISKYEYTEGSSQIYISYQTAIFQLFLCWILLSLHMWWLLRWLPVTPLQMGKPRFGVSGERMLKASSLWHSTSLLEECTLQTRCFLLFFFSKVFQIYKLLLEEPGTLHIAFNLNVKVKTWFF